MRLCAFIIICVMVALLFCATKNIDVLNKICQTDKDCRFVALKCCPGCDGFDSVNMVAGGKIEQRLEADCKDTACPAFGCESKTGEAVTGEPACINYRCGVKNTINCQVFCRYAKDSTYADYIQKTTELLGKTSAELSAYCKC